MSRDEVGMLLFICSESVFFLLLILAYVNFHQVAGNAVQASSMLDPLKTGMFSIALFTSSLTMWLSERSLERQDRRGVRIWLLATIVLGATFLVGQGIEYAELLTHNVTISRDMFGSTFFTLTGFHGFHVFIGLVLISMLTGLALFGRKHEPTKSAVKSISIYWHFVDAVWVVIFSIVYLWRYTWPAGS